MVVAVVATPVVAVVAVTKALAVSARLAPVMRRVGALAMVESVRRYGSSVALAPLARSPQVRVGSSVSAAHVPRPQAKTRDRCAPLHYIVI